MKKKSIKIVMELNMYVLTYKYNAQRTSDMRITKIKSA